MAWKPHTAEAFTGETWHGRPGYDPYPGQIPLSTGLAQIDRIVNFVRTEKTQPWGSQPIGVGNAETMHSSRPNSKHSTEREGLRRVPENRRPLGRTEDVPGLRACRMLRFVSEQACHQTLRSDDSRSEEHTSELQS